MNEKERKEVEKLIYSMRIPQLNILIRYYKNKKDLTDYQVEILQMANERKFLLTYQNDVVLRRRK